MSNIHVSGFAELDRMLQDLPNKIQSNIMRSALAAGARIVRDEAKSNLRSNGNVDTELLLKGLKVSTRFNRGTGQVTASVRGTGKHNYLARWIEYGVAAHSIVKGARRGNQHLGVMHPGFAGKAFMRPALDNNVARILQAVASTIKLRLTKHGINTSDVDIEINMDVTQ